MNSNKILTVLAIVICLLFAIFYPWKGDMTIRFSTLLVANSLHGYLYSDNKLRKINSIISLIIIIVVFILGFGFDYFNF